MATSLQEMMAAANAAVARLTPAQVREKLAAGALLIDVRDPNEVAASGKIVGALAVSRGMLEFRADPASQYHLPAFRKDVPVVAYCASGGRSALGGKALLDLGYGEVFNAGAFKDLVAAGLPTEPA